MNEKLKQCIMEMLRMGEDPDSVCKSLSFAYDCLHNIKGYKPSHDMADLYRAWKDADFRP
jgi:hypothetical protein